MKLSASIPSLKSQAKRLAKQESVSLNAALDRIAQREGYESWSLLAAKFSEQEAAELEALPKMITALPLTGRVRKEAVSSANNAFAKALGRMEARHPRKAHASWSAERYVDRVIRTDMLPIETEEALYLIETFIVMDAVEAAASADGDEWS
ncbi:MAG: hypothetical protein EOP84_28675 [Verrucomicrobiaceae bacterium]|nr:MAG: hypothetical protein EOP84_28675 [Verrucomicrobiaceae bacterium]